jgi:mannose-6-phosphate isomerase
MYPLKGVVQHYSWGGYRYIPGFLGIPNEVKEKPFAEYWLGAHPAFPSQLEEGTSLDEFIQQHKEALGKEVSSRFSSLPFLFKVLDVWQMLSIQVHPSKEAAERGYAEENAAGIPLNAPNRNYKDENHKPELMVALDDFWLLHGFKPEDQLEKVLQRVPELAPLLPLFREGGYRALYQKVMNLKQEETDRMLQPLAARVLPLYEKNKLSKEEENFWAARAIMNFCGLGQFDRGIFSVYFFNLLHLKKGEGIFQPEGLPHAYLEGQNIEIMANSDNVLRGGLTEKHIDISELMKHVKFEATHPQVIQNKSSETHKSFTPPVAEFELHQYDWKKGGPQTITTHSAEIWLLLQGRIKVQAGDMEQAVTRGGSLFVTAGAALTIQVLEDALLFRAAVPSGEKN